jgi:hypothetical protein
MMTKNYNVSTVGPMSETRLARLSTVPASHLAYQVVVCSRNVFAIVIEMWYSRVRYFSLP